MNHHTFYEDDEIVVTAEAVVLNGERIPTRKIKRVSIERGDSTFAKRIDAMIDGMSEWAKGRAELIIEIDGFWTKPKRIYGEAEEQRLKDIRDAIVRAMARQG